MTSLILQNVMHLPWLLSVIIQNSTNFEEHLVAVRKCFKLLEIPQENFE